VESATIFRAQNRADLAEPEEAQLAIIERYLPEMLSESEIEAKVAEIIAAVGATSMADMGKVMGQATAAMAGQADGKVISGFVRKLLA
jgi:uncharacterized protein YqeY